MKKVFKFFMYSAMAVAVVAACTKDPVTNEDDKKPGEENSGNTDQPGAKADRELEEASIEATPVGDTLTFDLTADAAWTIAADECDWITVEPANGEAGEATVTFYVEPNQDGKDRSVSFFVNVAETETHKAGDIYEVFISQVKMEYSVVEKDMAFLQWMVDEKVYGDATPNPDWFNFNPEGFTGLNFAQDAAGKWYVKEIYYFASAEFPSSMLFNKLPETIDLPNLEQIFINCTADGTDVATAPEWCVCPLRGTELPTEWNCPNIWRVHLECTGMTGTISDSFAALPNLAVIFFRNNDFYGALPHNWASTCFERIGFTFNGASADSPNLGYVLPASLDVILNSEKSENPKERDQNMVQIGGAKNIANWVGYEKGWGQKRYVKFGGGAEDDLATWSPLRLLSAGSPEEIAHGGLRNPNSSDNVWYIDNWTGWWTCCVGCIPEEMVDWDQDAADAYTAEAATRARIY